MPHAAALVSKKILEDAYSVLYGVKTYESMGGAATTIALAE